MRQSQAQRVFVAFTYANLVLVFGILLCVAWWKWGFSWKRDAPAPGTSVAALSAPSADCVECHTQNEFMRSQIIEWERSAHADGQVGCYECHKAEAGDPDAMDHNGYTVSVLVSPKDCARCHVREVEEFAASRHSRGGDILDSLDNILGEQVEGVAAAVLGCQQCHGAPVEVLGDGTLSPASWPNTGIGRMNPDGSRGACSTCHTRHLFSVAVAREPAACGNCHMGPDHPQKDIYEESKHGVAFVANREAMNLDAVPWVLGQDYTAAPTCATCHMSAAPGLEVNHDFYLWHHEGRRARHGAAMMGPDYVQWHGFYEVADRFYNEFVPEAEALLPGVTEPFLQAEHHRWRGAQ